MIWFEIQIRRLSGGRKSDVFFESDERSMVLEDLSDVLICVMLYFDTVIVENDCRERLSRTIVDGD